MTKENNKIQRVQTEGSPGTHIQGGQRLSCEALFMSWSPAASAVITDRPVSLTE